MAVAETDIVNVALRMIAGDRITSLTDGSANANVANDMYDIVRGEMLRAHTWRFATNLVKLTRLATAPIFQFNYGYALPADWVRTVSVHDNDAGVGSMLYEEGEISGVGAILTSAEAVYMKYVYDLTDTNRMSAGFVKAFSTALARDMALPVGNSNTMREEYMKQAIRDLNRAKSTDSLGSPAKQRPPGSWVRDRFASNNGIFPR